MSMVNNRLTKQFSGYSEPTGSNRPAGHRVTQDFGVESRTPRQAIYSGPAIARPTVLSEPPTSFPPFTALLRTNLGKPPRLTDFAAAVPDLPGPFVYPEPLVCCGPT
jgi:hypothetical protein